MNDIDHIKQLMVVPEFTQITDVNGDVKCLGCGAKIAKDNTPDHAAFHINIGVLGRLVGVLMNEESKRRQGKNERKIFGRPRVH